MTDILSNDVDEQIPDSEWDRNASKRALDDLFQNAAKYQTTDQYRDLLTFITRFHFYAPFNAMLIHVQKPGAKFVLPAHRWRSDYNRTIKASALPIVILQPMGPVMFVFDVSETEGDANRIPLKVLNPFALRQGSVKKELPKTIHNAARDGIRISHVQHGSQRGGSISRTEAQNSRLAFADTDDVPVRYEILLNTNHDVSIQYAVLVHELAHLYCGHLGTPNTKWWPDRRNLPIDVQEFEAESVSHLVCHRIGIETSSDEYLAGYYNANKEVPSISLDRVLASAHMIEEMGKSSMLQRKESK